LEHLPVKDIRFFVRNVLWFLFGMVSWFGFLLWLPFIVLAVCLVTLLLTRSPRIRWYVASTLLGLTVYYLYSWARFDNYIAL
jgi:hypothetical protein